MGSIGQAITGAQDEAVKSQFSDGGYNDMYGNDKIHSKEFTSQIGNYIKQNQDKMVNGISQGDESFNNQMNTIQNSTNSTMNDLNNKYGGSGDNVFSGENYDNLLNSNLNSATDNLNNQQASNRASYGLANDQLTKLAQQKLGNDLFNAQEQTKQNQSNASINSAMSGMIMGNLPSLGKLGGKKETKTE